LSLVVLSEFRCCCCAVREGTCVPNAMPGVSPAFLGVLRVATVGSSSGSHMKKFESVNSNILLRTVSLRVPIIPSPVGVCRRLEVWSSGLGIGRSKETMRLQLMCCALSETSFRLNLRMGQRVVKMDERGLIEDRV